MQCSLLFLLEIYDTDKRDSRTGKTWLARVQSQHKTIKRELRKNCFIDLDFHPVWLDLKGLAKKNIIVVKIAHFQQKYKYCDRSFWFLAQKYSLFYNPNHCGPFKYAFGEIIPWLFSKKFKMMFFGQIQIREKQSWTIWILFTYTPVNFFICYKERSKDTLCG